MGYRSEVVVAFTKEKLKEFINSDDTTIGALSCFICGVERFEKNGWFLFHHDWVKWYEEYPEVKAVMRFIEELESEGNEDFEFHRMGEESDDYEVRGHGNSPFDINISRSLNFYTD